MSKPLGQPPVQLKKSPLTPTVVIWGDAARSIDDTVSRPVIVPLDRSGVSRYSPCGFGAVTTYIAIGPADVHRRMRSYVTPGISCVGRAEAGGTKINPTTTAMR